MTITKKIFQVILFVALGYIGAVLNLAQETKPAALPQTEKAEEIIKRGIEAVGGAAYLNVQNVVRRGFSTSYQDGISQLPTRFIDYIAYPDKERTEFFNSGIRVVQANTGATGWLYD